MTPWLLILTMTLNGETAHVPAGMMVDQRLCTIAGMGMVGILETANPGLVVAYVCVQGAAA